DALAVGRPGHGPIHPQFLARTLDEVAAEDAIFTVDVGTPVVWAARYLRMNGRRRLIGSFTHGSMANAMPQAIGAQAAFPGRRGGVRRLGPPSTIPARRWSTWSAVVWSWPCRRPPPSSRPRASASTSSRRS